MDICVAGRGTKGGAAAAAVAPSSQSSSAPESPSEVSLEEPEELSPELLSAETAVSGGAGRSGHSAVASRRGRTLLSSTVGASSGGGRVSQKFRVCSLGVRRTPPKVIKTLHKR